MGGRKIIFMSENINNNVVLEEEESAFDFKQLWNLFVLNWHWFIVSIVSCLLIAFVYLWFTPTTYTVSNKMQLLGDSKQSGAASAKAAVLNSLPMGLGSSMGGGSLGIEAEKEILRSNILIREVVNDLSLHTEYRMGSFGRSIMVYKFQPLIVTLDPAHLQWMDDELLTKYHEIDLTIHKSSEGYNVEPILKLGKEETELPSQTFETLPATLKTEYGTLTITENTQLTAEQREGYAGEYNLDVTIVPPMTMAQRLVGKLSLEPPTKKITNLLNITMQDDNHIRAIDVVNHLVEVYNKRANDEKNEEARKTDEFVNARLAKIDVELGSSDAAWENSKKNFQSMTPEVDAQEALTKKSAYEAELVAIGTELQLHDYLSEYVNNPANLYEIIPAGISSNVSANAESGASASAGGSAGTASLLAQHNSLVNQRRELLKSVSEMSPQFQRVTQSIQELQPVIQTALKRDRQSILMRQNTLQREYAKFSGRIGVAPQMERVLTEIGRQREIKQGVYLLMLQKREEAAMELAKFTRKGQLIDETMISGPAKPDKKIILLVALILGALLPMGILYFLQMLKQKIDMSNELEAITCFPLLSEIPLQDNGDAIRDLRTNLLLNTKENQKAILIVSNADGDGKTYIAQHLTDSLNAIGKKAFLIDGDMRKSNRGGHPLDVLSSESFAKEVAKAKAEYDYVIFDSPAMSQYADAYQLATFADATLFVVKSGVTDKSVIEALNKDGKLPNVMLVLNAIDTTTKKYKLNKKN